MTQGYFDITHRPGRLKNKYRPIDPLLFEYRSKGLGWLALERVSFLGNKQQYDKAG